MPVAFNPFTGNLDLLGEVDTSSAQTITNKTLGNTREATGTITDGLAVVIDMAGPGFQSWSLGATRTATITNVAAGRQVKLSVTSNGHGLTLIGANWGDAGPPELGLVTDIELWSDNGSTVKGAVAWRTVVITGYTLEVTTTEPNTVFTLRTNGGVNYYVDWGDGDSDAGVTSNAWPHTYAAAGTYTVTVESAALFRFRANNFAPDNQLITAVIGAPDNFPWAASFAQAWYGCSSLTSFPLFDVSMVTTFQQAWRGCSSLTSFPPLDVSGGLDFVQAWYGCTGLTDFPLLDVSIGRKFSHAWYGCTGLTNFPAGFFDSLILTPDASCFSNAWAGCTSLSATSVENILNSIDTSGQSAPFFGQDITIDYNASSGTPNIATAVANLKSRGWTITLNGVAQ